MPLARAAVERRSRPSTPVMPMIVRHPYAAVSLEQEGIVKPEDVADREKMLPRDHVTPDGFHITA